MTTPDTTDPAGNQLIARVAAVLEALGQHPAGMSLGQIAQATQLPRSTIQRLVRGLHLQGLVIAGKQGVRLGPAITRLAAASRQDVVATAIPCIEAAGRRCRETIDLSVFREAHALLVYQYPSDQELRVISAVGSALPVYCTAHGKALLAGLEDGAVRVLLRGPLAARTAHTCTGVNELLADLAATRQRGFAVDCEEHANGVCGLGITLRTGGTERYALSIAVPALRFAENREALGACLLRCKAEIEQALASGTDPG